ncbi:hypothetical protein QZM97_13255 [Burkholderia orbicola]|uniref:hypothetical protein n=1 Tax=Burkholderia cepacia complex TaxID=87882 RepID=UPI000F66DAB4|nr:MULTISPECIES: hypothetical protein [Burkholderia cepacia complex]MDN7778762.1 hypothetical protein [Burkholderia orbicola]MDN7991050.1 hypothetical protein [Burkholderia orbicola]
MKKLVLAVAASAWAMSVYAANPDPIDFKVQLAGKVPSPSVFDVTHDAAVWDGSNIALTAPVDWKGGETDTLREVKWSVKSTYGPVRIKLRSPLQGKDVSKENRGVLVHDSGESIELIAAVFQSNGWWGEWNAVNREDGFEVLTAESAASGGKVRLRLRLGAPGGTPRSGTYTGSMTATFETGIED